MLIWKSLWKKELSYEQMLFINKALRGINADKKKNFRPRWNVQADLCHDYL